jgi:hypothetical protein
MIILAVVLRLLYADRWADAETVIVKLIGAFLQLFILNLPEVSTVFISKKQYILCT